ncbi:hypothetical protein GE061_002259 [Apolygus lucorum]|uniref:Uncharacterized protein n=1 Tax=Apolygus lucorum TaxID=248454 RepID=A0A8S9X6F5_APOLU|nr:hypothetical protein GE061_002259 [Apolygus lucorum]
MASTSREITSGGNAVMDDRRELSLRSRVVNVVTSTTPERVLENRGADKQSDRSSRRTGRSSSSTSTVRRRDVEQLRLELQQEEEKEAMERQARQADRERRLRALELAISNGSEGSRTRASVGHHSDTNSVGSNGRDKVEAVGNAGAWDIAVQNFSICETCKRGEGSKSNPNLKEDGKFLKS